MQDYLDYAAKNGVQLLDEGPCQFCGAATQRGVHECLEIFNLGFQDVDYTQPENHQYRFMVVDAHTLQHPEIHGRWNNHFHLTRLHLVLTHRVKWSYGLSPQLSNLLNTYKVQHADEVLVPPPVKQRGTVTTTDVLASTDSKAMIKKWAATVYQAWEAHHSVVEGIASRFLATI